MKLSVKHSRRQEADWNDRHHVLHSAANRDFHESDKDDPQ